MRQIGEALTEYKTKLQIEREARQKQAQTSAEIRDLATAALVGLFSETFQIDLSPITFELEQAAIFYAEQSSREYTLSLVYDVNDSSSVLKRRCTCMTSFIYVIATGEVYPHSVLPGKNGLKLSELTWYIGGVGLGVHLTDFIAVLHYLVEGTDGTH